MRMQPNAYILERLYNAWSFNASFVGVVGIQEEGAEPVMLAQPEIYLRLCTGFAQ